jgi:hypothetical protein
MDTQLKENLTMKNVTRNRERGVALFFSIFALLLLTAIAGALIFMATTETSINSNYRQEQTAFFAAKAGIEEARARMMPSDPNTINPSLPLSAPTNSAASPLIYIVNPGAGNAVQPWNGGNQWADDELCHDGYTALGLTAVAPDVRCNVKLLNTLAANAYLAPTSQLPYSATAPVPYKWVRVAPKLNGSILGPGTTITNPAYNVNAGEVGTTPVSPVCWDGVNEWVLNSLVAANCGQMNSANSTYMTNVYILTSLGVSSDAPNAARKVLQAEVALSPTPPFPYGLFATSTACPAITFNGNNASTNSYTTANNGAYGPPPTGTTSTFGGDVGSNGGVSVGNGNIAGIVGVLQPPPLGNGTCATPLTVGPNGATLGPNCTPPANGCGPCPGPTGPNCFANTATNVPKPYVFPTPPAPNPLPPTTAYAGGNNLVPGSYGNISITGNTTLTLAPGTYNINSLSMAGKGEISVNPPGAVTLNVAGQGNANPVAIAGNGIVDDTIPNDFIINYAGAGTVSIAGNGNVTAILNAPNATLTQVGNGNWYGAILANNITISGNGFFHFDRNAALAPANNGYYTLISFREVPY